MSQFIGGITGWATRNGAKLTGFGAGIAITLVLGLAAGSHYTGFSAGDGERVSILPQY